MAVTYQDILSDLKSNQYAPVYFLQGEESYFIDQIINYIEKNALEESLKSFNQVVLYGKDADLPSIINHAKGFPMMAERKVVIVKEAQEVVGITGADGELLLVNYLENPQPSTILVFGYKYKKMDKRKKLGKTIDKHAVFLTTTKFYDNQLPSWVEGYVKEKKRKIDQQALQLIVDNIGNNITRIANEIDKMLINLDGDAQITSQDVYRNIGISKEYNVFELQKALAFRNALKCNEIIHYFESDPKSNPIIPIIANLYSYFNKLLLLHHSKDKSDRHLASLLGVHPFFVKEYHMAAKNYNVGKLVANIHYLKIADMKSKGIDYPSQPEGQILKELIFSLIH